MENKELGEQAPRLQSYQDLEVASGSIALAGIEPDPGTPDWFQQELEAVCVDNGD